MNSGSRSGSDNKIPSSKNSKTNTYQKHQNGKEDTNMTAFLIFAGVGLTAEVIILLASR